MLKPVLHNPWVQAVGAVLALVLLVFLCYLLTPVLVPLFFAFLVAYVLNPVVDFFQARRIPRGVTICGFAVLAILVLLAIPLFLIPNLISEAEQLISAASNSATSGTASRYVDRLLNKLPLDQLVRDVGWAAPDAEPIDERAILAEHIGTYIRDNAVQFLRNYAPQFATAGQKVGNTAAQFFASIGRGTYGVLLFLGNLALFAFVAGYLLKDFHRVIASAKGFVPPAYQQHVFDVMGKINLQVRGFLRGQMLVCFCLGTMYMIGMLICRVPFAIPLALCGGVASFVPFMGVALTIGPALGLTLLQHGVDWHLPGVVVAFWVAHAIEGSILTPKIMGEHVGLNPVWVILAIMVFGTTLGFLGLLLAVPIAASLKVLVVEAVAYYKGSPLFEGGADSGGGDSGSGAG